MIVMTTTYRTCSFSGICVHIANFLWHLFCLVCGCFSFSGIHVLDVHSYRSWHFFCLVCGCLVEIKHEVEITSKVEKQSKVDYRHHFSNIFSGQSLLIIHWPFHSLKWATPLNKRVRLKVACKRSLRQHYKKYRLILIVSTC